MTPTRTTALREPRIDPRITAAVAETSRIRTREIDRVAYAADASHYLFTPQAVVIARDAAEVAAVLAAASASRQSVTFRSGGTSLSGQASGDGVLIDVRQRFRGIRIEDDGRRVRAEPGATVRQVNARLARFGRRLGPDPASEAACTIGGVVANNSSGMACGTIDNTYNTLESLIFVLPSGTIVDTAAAEADALLAAREPHLVAALERLRRRVNDDPASVALIRRQFAMKNTMGYGLNAFLDFESPAALLAHLVIGSEGTLAFVAEATFRTVPISPEIATTVAVFETLDAATRALPALVDSGAATLELMDATSLRVGQTLAGVPTAITGFDVTNQAALLIEYHANSIDELHERMDAGGALLAREPLFTAPGRTPATLSTDAAQRAAAWKFRKGLYASVAGARPSGTTALLEDVVVPVERLAPTCRGLQELFAQYAYADSVIFGHAKDGNIHFMLTDRFAGDEALARYEAFTERMVDLILDAGGNLKAEHGTGRAMAPFVRRQYGDELYDVMVELKRVCDPAGILNPGVIIESDPSAHVQNLKMPVTVEHEVDRCVECGYCEPVCPSRDLTLTPRQRIVVRRAHAAAERDGDRALAHALERDYDYAGVQTCAVDGMCQTACPVLINTGDLVKRLRREDAGGVVSAGWATAARAWGAVTATASVALNLTEKLPEPIVEAPNRVARAVLGSDVVPLHSADLPGGGPRRSRSSLARAPRPADPVAVYLPTCQSTMFGPAIAGGAGLQASGEALLQASGTPVVIPQGIDGLCCGTPWSSKGMKAGYERMREKTLAALWEASQQGELPVVVDASSCAEGVLRFVHDAGEHGDPRAALTVIDAVVFVRDRVLPGLALSDPGDAVGGARPTSLTLHPTCSSTQLGSNDALLDIGRAIAADVTVPDNWSCCGFAGDRGMLHPELTASATAAEAAAARALDSDLHASCNRACELGMTRAVGEPYRGVLELLAERAGLV